MRNFNLPNLLTIIRILALPFCVYALFKNGGDDSTWRIIAWTLFFIVGMTDTLDGKLARSRNQVTPLGTFLDPIADKAVIGTALIGLSILGDMPWWITIFILSRELLVTLLRLVVIKRGVIPASRGGKIKTLTQNFSVGFYILPLPSFLFLPRDIFLGVALILTLVTGIDYLRKAISK
ncbi:MAG: CDP-diacylglycerol--glycerol-3-phosphate 3-phosphatidyltransferase [Actinobacteria bacterium]|jgi:CDP-diacylglycerol--glycerol-3-phosphate 3-phosphatidyltransferase|nr:CDP-diacylglycerol--glycerol-3-phosphate 3-phosphatidyltransferase [Actinomycetota bacterium]NDH12838.1 CDP-diacylglycerol--glycerol-3-phosphate 3-phosphatidyltransferase [Actinomycetota bacterium]TRZ86526.1 MAG: CDP-diacylglycerol--glycerol-3-phosphate 3-phosphatidyltransferase [Streptomycetaceae bacterium]